MKENNSGRNGVGVKVFNVIITITKGDGQKRDKTNAMMLKGIPLPRGILNIRQDRIIETMTDAKGSISRINSDENIEVQSLTG